MAKLKFLPLPSLSAPKADPKVGKAKSSKERVEMEEEEPEEDEVVTELMKEILGDMKEKVILKTQNNAEPKKEEKPKPAVKARRRRRKALSLKEWLPNYKSLTKAQADMMRHYRKKLVDRLYKKCTRETDHPKYSELYISVENIMAGMRAYATKELGMAEPATDSAGLLHQAYTNKNKNVSLHLEFFTMEWDASGLDNLPL